MPGPKGETCSGCACYYLAGIARGECRAMPPRPHVGAPPQIMVDVRWPHMLPSGWCHGFTTGTPGKSLEVMNAERDAARPHPHLEPLGPPPAAEPSPNVTAVAPSDPPPAAAPEPPAVTVQVVAEPAPQCLSLSPSMPGSPPRRCIRPDGHPGKHAGDAQGGFEWGRL